MECSLVNVAFIGVWEDAGKGFQDHSFVVGDSVQQWLGTSTLVSNGLGF